MGKLTKCCNTDKNVYYQEDGLPGVLWDFWYGEQAAPHGPTGDIFNVPGTGPWGLNGHINGAPSESGTHPDFNFTDIALVGRDNAGLGPDQYIAYGFLKLPSDGFIVERNGNTGETGRVFLGQDDGCCKSRMELIADVTVSTGAGGTPRGLIQDGVAVKAGFCPAYFELSDLSAFSGGQFQFSESLDGPFVNIDVCQTAPEWKCKQVPCDYVLQEGETWSPPLPCCPTPYLAGTDGGSGLPADWRCEEVCAVVGFVTVSATGTVVQSCGDPVVTKTGTGSYNITAPAGALTSNAWAIIGEPENNNTNDVRAHFSSSFTTGDFHIEQQVTNGNQQWVDVDKPFTVQWFGKRTQVVCDNSQ